MLFCTEKSLLLVFKSLLGQNPFNCQPIKKMLPTFAQAKHPISQGKNKQTQYDGKYTYTNAYPLNLRCIFFNRYFLSPIYDSCIFDLNCRHTSILFISVMNQDDTGDTYYNIFNTIPTHSSLNNRCKFHYHYNNTIL